MRQKELPRRKDGSIKAPPEREGMWGALTFIDVAMRMGINQEDPEVSDADPMIYNTVEKVMFLRRSFLELGLAVLEEDFDRAQDIARERMTEMSGSVFAPLDKPKRARGKKPRTGH